MRPRATFALVFAPALLAGSHLDDGIAYQRAGRINEADRELRSAITELHTDGDRPRLLKALSLESWISVSLGNYPAAIQQATQAVELRHTLHDDIRLADDLNTRALANQNLGRYGAALEDLELALRADRDTNDAEGEITRLDNIGNVYYLEGRYFDALQFYQQAKSKVDATSAEPWNPRRRHVTLANMAALYQILGKEEEALELYRTMAASSRSMPPRERAQLLANQGALYRRLGDPVRALELYASAQELYRDDRYSDGEIGVLRNTGIARVNEMADPEGALTVFSEALQLARNSSNRRAEVQAGLYRSEALRLLHRLKEAAADAQSALEGAKSSGLVEEQWRALYVLGRVAEEQGHEEAARKNYRDAVALIESMRAELQTSNLRNDFLADKRDVYDALIDLRLRDGAPVDEVFRLIEHSRARVLNDRASIGAIEDLPAIQKRLGPDSILLDIWTRTDSLAIVWISSSRAGFVRRACRTQEIADKFLGDLQAGKEQWRDTSRLLGELLLTGIPLAPHLAIVPDGPLSTIPFEVITEPKSKSLLIELSGISYLPSAQFLRRGPVAKRLRLPWQREMVALGDATLSHPDVLDQEWQRLPFSGVEIRSIGRILPGRSEIHTGADAQKRYIQGRRVENLPVLHFSTHALVDSENPDRSRILLASDYLFLGEVYGLDLKGVDLVTVSACDTARGKSVRGEGVQAFSRAFLAAGADSTVTSLWRVDDESTAAFMKQFYYFLSKGQGKSEALRSAKLAFLRARTGIANPRCWGAFVLTGDGVAPLPRVIPWGILLLAGAAILTAVALAARFAVKAGQRSPQMATASTESHPL